MLSIYRITWGLYEKREHEVLSLFFLSHNLFNYISVQCYLLLDYIICNECNMHIK